MAIMWYRVTLRTRITLLTMFALTLVTVSLTMLSIYNAERHFVIQLAALESHDMDDMQIFPHFEPYEFDMVGIEFDAEMSIIFRAATAGSVTQQALRGFQIHSVAIAAFFILIGTSLAYTISSQTLRPIKSLAEKMEDIDVNNLSAPIPIPKQNDEVSRLTHSFNNMLTKINRSFETQKFFAQNAAHELKTPLASIRTNIEVFQLDANPSEDEYKEVINTVKDDAERLIELMERLLQLNSIVSEKNCQSFDVRDVFEVIIDDLKPGIIQKALSVELRGGCMIKGDKVLLERAFYNVVHNAVRYNVSGGKVDIILSENCIVVEDSGVGIPAEHLSHIFEPFYCVDNSRSRKLGGSGLGMAIAKNIFDKHNMETQITSETKQGTKMIIYFG